MKKEKLTLVHLPEDQTKKTQILATLVFSGADVELLDDACLVNESKEGLEIKFNILISKAREEEDQKAIMEIARHILFYFD